MYFKRSIKVKMQENSISHCSTGRLPHIQVNLLKTSNFCCFASNERKFTTKKSENTKIIKLIKEEEMKAEKMK